MTTSGKLLICGLIWFGGGAIIGAEIFATFKRPWFGAAIGIAAVGILFVLLTMEIFGW
jgi:hypothetical protein